MKGGGGGWGGKATSFPGFKGKSPGNKVGGRGGRFFLQVSRRFSSVGVGCKRRLRQKPVLFA